MAFSEQGIIDRVPVSKSNAEGFLLFYLALLAVYLAIFEEVVPQCHRNSSTTS
jgi:hypothetical protein